ncbi:MAG: hypothetical protein QOJ27_666 [Sphingomonadales bacterium]|jgi:hypothetical protein|nr:hypothetical protein [Sphingomonadales bacterium]
MAIPPIRQPLTLETLRRLLDPGRVFYRPAVDDALHRGELHEIQELLQGAKDVQAKYGDLNGLIKTLEAAAQKAR